jgi:DNA sulfur modification protein DndE
MPVEHIRISQQAKDQLIKLKRNTGLQNWNVLCRWAFCLSIADPSVPSQVKLSADSSVEMSWKVFGGTHHELYLALLKERCHRDGVGTDDHALTTYFRLHLHRGIGYLGADRQLKSITALMNKVPRLNRHS